MSEQLDDDISYAYSSQALLHRFFNQTLLFFTEVIIIRRDLALESGRFHRGKIYRSA
jgi:hypothetical protein